jgi:hypothetical protein
MLWQPSSAYLLTGRNRKSRVTTTNRIARRRTMSDWVMTFSYEGLDPTMAEIDKWTAQLEAFDGSVARIPSRGVVDVTVYAPGDFLMVDAVAKMAIEVGHVVMAEPTGMEIVREVEWRRRAEAPTMPELMSAAEIANELGVSRQRVHKLRHMATFPLPLAELRGGAVWDAVAVRKFAKNWIRKPGRPSANAAAGGLASSLSERTIPSAASASHRPATRRGTD